jgi:hypothetical protein
MREFWKTKDLQILAKFNFLESKSHNTQSFEIEIVHNKEKPPFHVSFSLYFIWNFYFNFISYPIVSTAT